MPNQLHISSGGYWSVPASVSAGPTVKLKNSIIRMIFCCFCCSPAFSALLPLKTLFRNFPDSFKQLFLIHSDNSQKPFMTLCQTISSKRASATFLVYVCYKYLYIVAPDLRSGSEPDQLRQRGSGAVPTTTVPAQQPACTLHSSTTGPGQYCSTVATLHLVLPANLFTPSLIGKHLSEISEARYRKLSLVFYPDSLLLISQPQFYWL